jgi:eukaryotic-like serine/threonine-protein kinase
LFSAAVSGELVYLQGSNAEMTELAWVDRAGRELEIAAPPGLYYWPRLSHDGRRIAVDLSDAVSNAGDIWIFDVARKLGDRFTSHPLNETCPAWSPDDSRLYWLSSVDAEGTGDIHSRTLRENGREETTYRSKDIFRPFDVSPDGRSLLVGRRSADRRGNLDVLELSLADSKVTPLLDSEHAESVARWSRDGRWLVYVSDESGRLEIYIRRNPDSGEKWRVSTRGGTSPIWRANGREIFYAEQDGQIMSVSFQAEPTVELGVPAPLFRAELFMEAGGCFDVASDGQRFLINRLVRARNARMLTLDQGWSSSK